LKKELDQARAERESLERDFAAVRDDAKRVQEAETKIRAEHAKTLTVRTYTREEWGRVGWGRVECCRSGWGG
jgi:hypothetical protein